MTQFTEAYDFRGRTLVDRDGEKIGTVDEVYTDAGAAASRSGRSSIRGCLARARASCRCAVRPRAAGTCA